MLRSVHQVAGLPAHRFNPVYAPWQHSHTEEAVDLIVEAGVLGVIAGFQ